MTSIEKVFRGNTQSISQNGKHNKNTKLNTNTNQKPEDIVDVYESQNNKVLSSTTYTPDLDKVKAMKDETDKRLFELFKKTVSENFSKQSGGLRGILDKLVQGEKVSIELELNVTEEDIEKAKSEVAEDGYWGVDATSDRFIEFAKALSGGDPSKIELLKNSFIEGYEAAEEVWGGELPEISQRTYEATLEKFDNWANESNQPTNI